MQHHTVLNAGATFNFNIDDRVTIVNETDVATTVRIYKHDDDSMISPIDLARGEFTLQSVNPERGKCLMTSPDSK